MSNHRLDEPLARGRTSAIYAWENGKVLKVFHAWFPADDVEYEARIARAVHSRGLRVPDVGDILEVDGRLGLEYERLDGISLWEEMQAKPWAMGKYANLLASLHAEIHETADPGDLPSLRDKLEKRIRNASEISSDTREASLSVLRNLAVGNRLCHGDFHPGNVILTIDGPVVIDWIDASIGSPPADVARTSILTMGELETPGLTSLLERAAMKMGHRSYRKRYFELRPGGEEEYQAWLPLVAAARLSEGIEELAPWLRKQADIVLISKAN